MLRENRHKLDAVVALPLVHESLDEPQIYSLRESRVRRPHLRQPSCHDESG
jgi:hypothetical protein